jgi:hypothetical protein
VRELTEVEKKVRQVSSRRQRVDSHDVEQAADGALKAADMPAAARDEVCHCGAAHEVDACTGRLVIGR